MFQNHFLHLVLVGMENSNNPPIRTQLMKILTHTWPSIRTPTCIPEVDDFIQKEDIMFHSVSHDDQSIS